jgi:hypothetical protein
VSIAVDIQKASNFEAWSAFDSRGGSVNAYLRPVLELMLMVSDLAAQHFAVLARDLLSPTDLRQVSDCCMFLHPLEQQPSEEEAAAGRRSNSVTCWHKEFSRSKRRSPDRRV